MNEQPYIAFCTTCKGRTQHLEATLPKNLADNAGYERLKFVVLDYGSDGDLAGYLRTRHRVDIESGRLVVYRHDTDGPFRMAHAKNMAHRLGIQERADMMLNLDADNFTGPGFAEYMAEHMSASPDVFLWTKWNAPDMRGAPIPKGCGGRIAVSVASFMKTGGYDEQFAKWGPDDKDFNFRLRRLGGEARQIDPTYLGAVLHNDKVRFREYPEAQASAWPDQFEQVMHSEATVVNNGRVGEGAVRRNYSAVPAELGPMPTRIFGVGMHKTATTSLNQALRMLGFDSAHWKDAHWAKAIWDEVKSSGRSLTLEKSYALCDLPITLLYKELDAAYPGSKFILTVRDEVKWIESVERHWSREHNPFRSQWDTDPFTHRIHRELYGCKSFDTETMLARYRRHNAEVLEYFKDRPGDLVVMDMDAGAGWSELCRFLKRPMPSSKYPRLFVTKA